MNCKNSWLHISQNGDDYDDDNEWTMIGFGFKSDNRFNAWYISSNGKVSTQSIDYKYYMRPVFWKWNIY